MAAPFSQTISNKTMIAVVRLTAVTSLPTGAGGEGILSIQNANQTFDAIVFNEGGTQKWCMGSSNGNRSFVSPSTETSLSPLIMTYTSTGGDYRIYRNGSLLANSSSFSPPNLAGGQITLGMRHFDPNTGSVLSNGYLYGDIAEVLLYTPSFKIS